MLSTVSSLALELNSSYYATAAGSEVHDGLSGMTSALQFVVLSNWYTGNSVNTEMSILLEASELWLRIMRHSNDNYVY